MAVSLRVRSDSLSTILLVHANGIPTYLKDCTHTVLALEGEGVALAGEGVALAGEGVALEGEGPALVGAGHARVGCGMMMMMIRPCGCRPPCPRAT